jgi:hypothetical protein
MLESWIHVNKTDLFFCTGPGGKKTLGTPPVRLERPSRLNGLKKLTDKDFGPSEDPGRL